MTTKLPHLHWSSAARIAWRESRASTAKFLFVVLAVALGVACLVGVRSFSSSFERMLLEQARVLMAADLTVRVFDPAGAEQQALLDSLTEQGVRMTRITETVTMAGSENSPDPVLASVKAVDPSQYPYYGEVKLDPPGRLRDVLSPDTIVAATDVLLRLDVEPGGTVRIGASEFKVGAAVVFEPDRMTGSLNVGPRIMMNREALERAGLLNPGSRASQRFLFRLTDDRITIAKLNQRLREAFPVGLIADFREAHPAVQRGLERSTRFLSLVSLIALIVGALGVASAIHSHIQQKLDVIAVMKCLGARSSQIIRIYALQAGMLGLVGSLIGLAAGVVVQKVFPILIVRYFPLEPDFRIEPSVLAMGLAIGLLTTMLFTLPPLLGIRNVRPALVFRRSMAENRPPLRQRARQWLVPGAAGAIILLGLGALAAWVAGSGMIGGYFAGGLAASMAMLGLVAWLLLRGLAVLVKRAPIRLASLTRHGLANLFRPGSQAIAILVALGIGVMFTQTVYLVQHSMLADIARSAPEGMPNLFLINITAEQRLPIAEFLGKSSGVEGEVELVPSVSARLVNVNGEDLKERLPDRARRLRGARSVNWTTVKPSDVDVLDGSWWPKDARKNWVAVNDRAADDLKVTPGMTMAWRVGGETVEAEVACIYKRESVGIGSNVDFLFNEQALAGLPVLYWAAARVDPSAVPKLIRGAYRQFPAVTVINAADVLAIVQDVVDQVALVVRFVSAFAILAGIVILASSIAGTRFRRIREIVILKTLGATKRQIARIFLIEFLVLGASAGLLGALLASGFSALILKRVFQSAYTFDWLPFLICIAATALIAVFAGWMTSWKMLGEKPLEVLRQE